MEHDTYVVLSMHGTIDLRTSSNLVVELDRDLLQPEARDLVADLTDVDFLDSTGLTALVRAGNALDRAGHSLTLVAAGGPVRRVLEVSGVDQVFSVVSTLAQARSE